MSAPAQLPAEAVRFRTAWLDALARFHAPGDFTYIDADTAIVRCAVCGGWASVRFHGLAPAADLRCITNGCAEADQVAKLREVVR